MKAMDTPTDCGYYKERPKFPHKEKKWKQPRCVDCKHFMLYSLLPGEKGYNVCTLWDVTVHPVGDWCYDYKRKWWKVWR